MATFEHPITGVTLNEIGIRRKSLSPDDAVTACILRLQDVSMTEIVHLLGTNANRVGEVFSGQVHPAAASRAVTLLRQHNALLV